MAHEHQHEHGHGHGHSHGHGHGHGHQHKHEGKEQWSGDDYLAMPGVRKVAQVSYDSIVHAMTKAGFSSDEMKKLNVLEVGCGAGAVTQHLVDTFASVHSIDTSNSMLLTLSKNLPQNHHNLTWGNHALTPDSPAQFHSKTAMSSPTPEDQERKVAPPRAEFDAAVMNLVLHHVDEVEPFLNGLKGLIKPGGWLVLTEFTTEGGDATEEDNMDEQVRNDIKHGKKDGQGSVNQPGHFHAAYDTKTIKDLLSSYGFTKVDAEVKGKVPVWDDPKKYPWNLVAWGQKAE